VVVPGIASRNGAAEPPYDRDVNNIIAVINPAIYAINIKIIVA
jgi:hypothetical protein